MPTMDGNTLHNRATEVFQRLRKLDGRLTRVTCNVCGSAPETGNGATPKPIEEHLHEKFNDISGVLLNLEEEMSRLENAVGSNKLADVPKAVAY